jgi:hypothetical protein
MDLPPDAGQSGPAPERLVAPPPARGTPADVAHRLEVMEARLTDLGARVDALSASVPAAVQAAVASEVGAVAGDLRHTVSELGRLLVRDLGKLSQILAQHRDTIVAEIRDPSPPRPPSSPEPPPTATEPEAAETKTPAPETEVELGDGDGDGGEEDPSDWDEEGGERSWRRRRRAR